MLRIMILAVGTVLAVLAMIQMNCGREYEEGLAELDETEYPLCDLFIIGFGWSNIGLLEFKGNYAASLKRDAAKLYNQIAAEDYARIVWAQILTYVHLALMVTFFMAGIFYSLSTFVFGAGIFLTVIAAVYSYTRMNNLLSERRQACENQLADVVSTMAILLNSGMGLMDAWDIVSRKSEGVIYDMMQETLLDMNKGGMTVKEALVSFGNRTDSAVVRKFIGSVLQNITSGGDVIRVFMENQSSELWNEKRQYMIQSGEKAATKLLLPTMLIFLGVIIIIMTAAFSGMLF